MVGGANRVKTRRMESVSSLLPKVRLIEMLSLNVVARGGVVIYLFLSLSLSFLLLYVNHVSLYSYEQIFLLSN